MGLLAGNSVYINFTSGTAVSGTYVVASVPDPTHFTVTTTNSKNQNHNSLSVYSLAPPPLMRSGTVVMQEDTWNMSYTDTGTTSSLSQSPLRSPTVFNFFYPGYEFPGALASAGLTTPEFQLTTASGVAAQMNFIEGGILNNTGNTNGLSSFTAGNGAIVLDLDPWMTTNYTANAGIPSLVSNLNTLLAAGQVVPRRAVEHHQLRGQHQFRLQHAADPDADARPRARRRSFDRQFAGLHHPKMIL